MAGIAHEINTPLGVIKASVDNMATSFDNMMETLPDVLHDLSGSEKLWQLFRTLVDRRKLDVPDLSSKEKRAAKRHMQQALSETAIEQKTALINHLIYMKAPERTDELGVLHK